MNLFEARKAALQLRLDGNSNREVADKLAKKGYVSVKTKKPLSQSGISTLITQGKKARKGAEVGVAKPQTLKQAILDVCDDPISSDRKIEIIRIICTN